MAQPVSYTWNVIADTTPFIIASVVAVDGHQFDVYFNKPAVESEALIPANYVTSPVLTVSSVSKMAANCYRVTTVQPQVPGQVYNVTVSNVHDIYGNLI